MRKEVRPPKTSFTRQELLSLIEKLFDIYFIDCCPNCQVVLDWRDCISEDDIKRKIEETGVKFTEVDINTLGMKE